MTAPIPGAAKQFSSDLASRLASKRIMLDVSVLLSGLLVDDSDSAALLAHARGATVLLSDHLEETALHVLRSRAPHLLGAFGEGRIRLATGTSVERVARGDPLQLPPWAASALDWEDQQVLADGVAARADILFVQDSAFFAGPLSGLGVQTPGALIWPLRMLDPSNVQPTPETWTFLGLFIPNWGSSALAGSGMQFYVFEVANHIACYYDAGESAFKLRWRTQSGARDTLTVPQPVEFHRVNFVAVAVGPTELVWFVNGETRGRRVLLGPAPAGTTFHPFMSAASQHQINGGVHFRVVSRILPEGLIRKHWRARTVRLTDQELQLHDMLGPILRPR
jgi:hypothetical protein